MTSREFCYWLQGFFELQPANVASSTALTAEQTQIVRNHLNMVFKHEIDPSQGSAEHQVELSAAHEGTPKRPQWTGSAHEGSPASADRPPVTVEQVKQLIKENPPSHFSPHGTALRC
jgi:hypothetical protein